MGLNFNKKQDIQNVLTLHDFLSGKTFAKRLQPYVDQIFAKGYFVYENCCFVPGDKIIWCEKEFPIHSTDFLIRHGVIEMRPKNYGLKDKVMDKVMFEMYVKKQPLSQVMIDPKKPGQVT